MDVFQTQFSKQTATKKLSKRELKELKRRREKFAAKQEAQRKENEARRLAERTKPFEELMQGKVCDKEELMMLQQLHYQFKREGYYVSVLEKYPEGTMHHKWKNCNIGGWNVDHKELEDYYYVPTVMVLSQIKQFNKMSHETFDCTIKGFKDMLRYSFYELRRSYNLIRNSMKDAIQKLILGKYSFNRYINYKQRFIVCDIEKKFVDITSVDTSIVPIPTFPIIPIPQEPVEAFIPRNLPLTISPIQKYDTPMDYYISVIEWCRRHTQYDSPEVLKIAFRKIIGNEILLKDCFQDMEFLGRFIRYCNGEYRYMMQYFNYQEMLAQHIEEQGRYELMRKTTRVLNLWKYPLYVGKRLYNIIRFMEQDRIQMMYENPKYYLEWLKENVWDYSKDQVVASIQHHGFITF